MMRSKSVIATPPGATIKEQLVDRKMSQKEFAARMDMSEKHISKLINGEVQLTTDMALRLEMVLGIPAQFWCNLEAIYREKLAKIEAENAMEKDLELIKKFPYAEMAKNHWVEETTKPKEKVINLRKYFEIIRLDMVEDEFMPNIACRRLSETEKSDYALIAWAQKAKLEARKAQTAPINIHKLKKSVPVIRKMTTKQPEVFCPQLITLLAECGIAIIFLPHIGGSFLHGATFYDGNKIIIGLTLRGKDADKFWFSLFHELSHIILGHIGKAGGTTIEDEEEADKMARDILIPQKEWDDFTRYREFSAFSMTRFAEYMGIDVGIVVGRLQKEKYIDYKWYNKLKTKYVLAS